MTCVWQFPAPPQEKVDPTVDAPAEEQIAEAERLKTDGRLLGCPAVVAFTLTPLLPGQQSIPPWLPRTSLRTHEKTFRTLHDQNNKNKTHTFHFPSEAENNGSRLLILEEVLELGRVLSLQHVVAV